MTEQHGSNAGNDKLDAALLRGLTQARVSRRQMLRYAGAGAGATGLAALLAACGVSGSDKNSDSPSEAASIWETAEKTGTLNFANWELYIDRARVNGKFVHPSIEDFEKKTGITVNYTEPIIENEQFFAKIQPSLSAGKDVGYDLIVITNGQTLSKLIRNDWLIPLEHDYLKNFDAHVADAYRDPSYDPGNAYTVPWQSGITGIGYNPKLTGRKITSFNDLFDPAFKGKVGMFGDALDLPNFAMQGLGINPETSTPDDWQIAADKLIEQRDAGIVRQYYTQNYIRALTSGDVALTMAWSGDIFQAQNSGSPELEFVVPDEGGIIWTDNMCIPAKAQHPVDAIMMMDYVYDPKVAAQIADWVWYITPVPEAEEIIRSDLEDPTVANSPLVFPTEDMYARLRHYRDLDTQEEEQWNSLFAPIYQS
jgi:spermidine/putrescine transport system substrate-binding protein